MLAAHISDPIMYFYLGDLRSSGGVNAIKHFACILPIGLANSNVPKFESRHLLLARV